MLVAQELMESKYKSLKEGIESYLEYVSNYTIQDLILKRKPVNATYLEVDDKSAKDLVKDEDDIEKIKTNLVSFIKTGSCNNKELLSSMDNLYSINLGQSDYVMGSLLKAVVNSVKNKDDYLDLIRKNYYCNMMLLSEEKGKEYYEKAKELFEDELPYYKSYEDVVRDREKLEDNFVKEFNYIVSKLDTSGIFLKDLSEERNSGYYLIVLEDYNTMFVAKSDNILNDLYYRLYVDKPLVTHMYETFSLSNFGEKDITKVYYLGNHEDIEDIVNKRYYTCTFLKEITNSNTIVNDII